MFEKYCHFRHRQFKTHTATRQFLRVWLVFASLLFCLKAEANLDRELPLNIQSQKLSDALIELGSQAEISIVFPSSLLLDKKSKALDDTLTPRQALDILLKDQAVEWQSFNSRVVSITRKPSVEIDSPPIFNTQKQLSEIVVIGEQVTGSRIKRLDWEGSAPVDIITESEIAARGVQAVSDYLKFIPAVSGNSTSTAVSNGGDGTATITLRGLPAANTLVLLNGRRTANSGAAGASVDLNSIPLVAVERIELLKDGASAIYGSDAIAGVVNIILKREFDGLIIDQYLSQTSRGDLETTNTSIVGGVVTDNASYMFTASHFDQEGIYSRNRKLSENADGRNQGGVDARSSATPFSRISLPSDPDDPFDDEVVVLRGDSFDPALPTSYRPATVEDRYNYREATSSMSPSTRTSLILSSIHGITDHSELVTYAGITESEATITFAPLPLFTANEDPSISVSPANPFNPFGVEIFDLRRRIVELGPRFKTSNEIAYRFSTLYESNHKDMNWDISLNWNKTDANDLFKGVIDAELAQYALSSDCLSDTDCVPLDLFGPPGSISNDQLDYIRTAERFKGESKTYELSVNADKVIETPLIDAISIAGGVSFRAETAKLEPKGQIGISKPQTTNGRRSIKEAYLETSIPLLRYKPFVFLLELELASRYSHYSDFGSTNNPKMGLRYRPTHDFLIRSTYSEGFRAPSLNQLHQDSRQEFQFLDDPCADADNVGVLLGCTDLADETIRQFLVVTGGNKELVPEQAVSKTAGIVWTPSNLNEFYLSLDWFWIEQSEIIDTRSQYILNQNALLGSFADQVVRENNGNLSRIVASNINVGKLNVRGIDATLRYRIGKVDYGDIVFSINASHIRDYKQQLDSASEVVDLAGTFADVASSGVGAIPKDKINMGLSWSKERWESNYNVFYVDTLQEHIPFSGDLTRSIDRWTTHNFQINYLAGKLKNIRLTAGIDNLLDRLPPFSASAFNDNFDPRTYEIKGRTWYGQVRYQF